MPVYASNETVIFEQKQELQLRDFYSVEDYVRYIAREYEINEYRFAETARCESGFVPQQSKVINKKGQREDSWGIFQIHLPDHPDVSREEAMDIEFATKWSAEQFKKGYPNLWSCYKKQFNIK